MDSIELHGFSDAFDRVYGACAFVCFRYSDGTCKNSLVTAKSRLKSPKKVSVPRLELLGILTVSRLNSELEKLLILILLCLKSGLIPVQLLAGLKRIVLILLKRFLLKIVRDIKKTLKDTIELRLVSSKHNPTEYVTKEGLSENVTSNFWLHGP